MGHKDTSSEAKALVDGARQQEYGPPDVNFRRIAEYWDTYLDGRLMSPITAQDVPIMMLLLKVARWQHGRSEDSLRDMHGYLHIIDILGVNADG